ncbi:ribosome small subunit-dependent GTPase A [Thermomonospora cellulosilytica]|uniref:Small ribosomal subunit biogenesis GTPase RsgA n=1 Tax=Thermomonospora cellulosilytica TaxID=1411118 RepID=A0A7W3MZC4_9ACTN|nr:ribosome small subunit-dependent GTPase A [Thermomonospora cellulosilytica]MBA9004655.1 ribosome biogenesis GTPase [Thermomonospora cellulosilytica]
MASSHFPLPELGWDGGWAAAFTEHTEHTEHLAGRVARVDKGACTVLTEQGELRAGYGAEPPCVGDWVAVRTGPVPRVRAILPRRTAVVRGGVGRDSRSGLSGDSSRHVLAANVDVAYIVEPAAPDTDLGRIERLLALAWESGAEPVVLITKADLAADLPGLLDAVASAAVGARVHAVSALDGDGLDAVRLRPGRTAVLLGPSGAGKSTLVNALAGRPVMRTGEVRAGDGRGRHTTTHRELLLLDGGGLVIDTPGLRRIGLSDDVAEGLAQTFADVEELAAGCRFADCAHESEPGCAVLAAVESGDLPPRRLASWRRLQREAAWMAGRADARLRAEQTRKWKIIHREMRRSGRNRP